MAIKIECINLIIPIEKINKSTYPGGFKALIYKFEEVLGCAVWYDEHLLRLGTMDQHQLERDIQFWESQGLVIKSIKDGKEQWEDMAVIFSGLQHTIENCSWLEYDPKQHIAWYKLAPIGEIYPNNSYISYNYSYPPREKKQFKILNIPVRSTNDQSKNTETWDYATWLKEFKAADKSWSSRKKLRTDVFVNTVRIVSDKKYDCGSKIVELDLNNSYQKLHDNTIFYEKPTAISVQSSKNYDTKISVINADCIEVGSMLKKLDFNPVVLNMANRQNPGGSVVDGSGAQEENIFRRTNIYLSLYQFIYYASKYGVEKNSQYQYPLNRQTGGIYSPGVTVFRSSEHNGYNLLKNPFKLAFVTVPALNTPELVMNNEKFYIADHLIEPTKEKIRTILRIAYQNNHDSVVLSAFGCGAFKNPPEHIAFLFKEVFAEDEFSKIFKNIIFAIIDDRNSWHEHNPEGNVIPFQRILD